MMRFAYIPIAKCAVAFVLWPIPLALAQEWQPPLENQPANFSRIVGSYRIQSSAAPKDVFAGDTIELQVRITGTTPAQYAAFQPNRKYLKIFRSSIQDDFFVEPAPHKDQYDGKQTWTFVFYVRRKHTRVEYIPALQLSYYDDKLRTYQRSIAPYLPISVKPQPKILTAPARFYEIATGSDVLQSTARPTAVSWWYLASGLLVPPLALLAGLVLWRRWFPDAVGQQRRRHSQAARTALRQLHQADNRTVDRISAIMSGYLRDRLAVEVVEPTPQELPALVRNAGLTADTAQHMAAFFQACHEVRFAPNELPHHHALPDQAAQLIQRIETEA